MSRFLRFAFTLLLLLFWFATIATLGLYYRVNYGGL